jgi:hypothetical protein
MDGPEARTYREDVGLLLLIGGFLLAPFAWLLEMQISYAMLKWACEHGRRGLILLMPIWSLGLVGLAAAMSWSCWNKKVRGQATEDGGRMEDRSYFLALAGLAMSALFALLILTSFAPRYFLSPCE